LIPKPSGETGIIIVALCCFQEYTAGRMTTAQIKRELIDCITPIVSEFQKARAKVTDDMVDAFMSVRKMDF